MDYEARELTSLQLNSFHKNDENRTKKKKNTRKNLKAARKHEIHKMLKEWAWKNYNINPKTPKLRRKSNYT